MFTSLDPRFRHKATFETPFGEVKEFYSDVYGKARIAPALWTNEPELSFVRNIAFPQSMKPEDVLALLEERWGNLCDVLELWDVAAYRTATRTANHYNYIYRTFALNPERTGLDMLETMNIVLSKDGISVEDDSFYAYISSKDNMKMNITIKESGIHVRYQFDRMYFNAENALDKYEQMMQKKVVDFNGNSVSLLDALYHLKNQYCQESRKRFPKWYNHHAKMDITIGVYSDEIPYVDLHKNIMRDDEEYTIDDIAMVNPVRLFELDYRWELERFENND